MWRRNRKPHKLQGAWQARLGFQALPVLLLALVAAAPGSAGEGFSGGVTPSRFELNSEAGELLRRSLKIYNLSSRPQQFNVRTVDWAYSEQGSISYSSALADNSCREWVRLERHRINVLPDPRRPRNFRFEVQVPENAPRRECRFAIMVENLQSAYNTQFGSGAVNMPVSGRIAVIVYLGIGGASPELKIEGFQARQHKNQVLPYVLVQNTGDAHGRLDGSIQAKDSQGEKLQLSVASTPILPGQRRYLSLTAPGGTTLAYPLSVRGKLYAADRTLPVNTSIDPL